MQLNVHYVKPFSLPNFYCNHNHFLAFRVTERKNNNMANNNFYQNSRPLITDRCKMYVMTGVLIAVEIRDEVSNHFPTVIVTFRLRRKPRYYTVNLIVPCCFFSLIVVSTFLLQPSSQDRLQVGTYAFLTSIIRPHFMVGVYVNEVARYQARVHVFRHPSTDS